MQDDLPLLSVVALLNQHIILKLAGEQIVFDGSHWILQSSKHIFLSDDVESMDFSVAFYSNMHPLIEFN